MPSVGRSRLPIVRSNAPLTVAIVSAVLACAGCFIQSSPTEDGESDGEAGGLSDTTSLAAVSSTSQASIPGDTVEAPTVRVTHGGEPMEGVLVEFDVAVGDGSSIGSTQATTDADGIASADSWQLGRIPATHRVVASLPDQADVETLEFVAEAKTDFSIELVYYTELSESQREAFESAKARWEGIVLNGLPSVTATYEQLAGDCPVNPIPEGTADPTTSLTIFVGIEPIDGQDLVLGQATPCTARSSDSSPASGFMVYDSADIDDLELEGTLESAVLHEMGHVLGIGGVAWFLEELIVDPSIEENGGTVGADTHFIGPNAQQAFEDYVVPALRNTDYDEIVPVENNGRAGSADSHWRESVLSNELMTPEISGFEQTLPLSILTIASLADLGYYQPNALVADPLTLEPSFRARANATATATADQSSSFCGELSVPVKFIDDLGGSVAGQD